MDRILAHRPSDIGGFIFYRYIVDYKRLDKVDIGYSIELYLFSKFFFLKIIIPFPKCIIDKILHGSSSFQGRTGLLMKWVSWNISV